MAEDGGAGAKRSTAIVLFTDLVASTELRVRLGEDAAEELRRTHDRLVTGAIEAKRGHLVKNLGDGMMATFAGASDAVAAAVTIQQALELHSRSGSSGVPLNVRIGISAGDVSFEDSDCFGTPVIEAARLCAAADGGQILVSDVVRALAGTAGGHRLVPVGALELKGLSAPVSTCEVAWEPAGEARKVVLPLPSVVVGVGRIFVGREEELTRLRQRWKEASAGNRRLTVVGGEPGVGKTRLAAALAQQLHAEGALVLGGRCDEDLGVPYQPFVEALRLYVTSASAVGLGRHAGELPRLVPELAELAPGLPEPLRSDPETERYRLFDAVAAWLGNISAEQTVLLVIDDLHWAAKPTLLLLRHILRSAEPLRLLIVATYRDTDLGRRHPLLELLADLPRLDEAERLPLTGLDVPGVIAFMEQAAAHSLDEEGVALAHAVWRETEGNAFFVGEVLRHLSEAGAITQQDGQWRVTGDLSELGIPAGVRAVVGRRVSRLSEDANRVLAIASVVGAEFEPTVVRAVGQLSEETVLAALEEAVAARLIVEVPGPLVRSRFSHALVRTTLYEELSAARRVALHRKVAEVLEALHGGALDDHLPALAYHWSRAGAPATEVARAVEYAARAGDRALSQLAHDEAAGYYQQALDLLALADASSATARQLRLVLALGEAQHRAGDAKHRETLLLAAELARRHGDVDALVRAALLNTRGLLPTRLGRVDAEKVDVLEAAVAAVGDADRTARARLLATLGVELTFTWDSRRCLALSDEALELARGLDDHETLARVLLTRYFPTCMPDLLAEQQRNTAELVAVVERVADPALKAEAHLLRARAAIEAGDVPEADRSLAIADRLSAGLGQPALRWRVQYVRAARAVLAARFPEAERLLIESHRLGQSAGQADATWVLVVVLWALRVHQERVDQETFERLEGEVGHVQHPWNEARLAVLACALGRDDEARAALDRAAADPPRMDIYWLVAMTDWAAVAAHLGDPGHAERIEAALRPYAARAVPFVVSPTPSVAHHLGLLATTLGHYDEADQRFREALATHERIGAPHFTARTRLEWAAMLLARAEPGDDPQAREFLGQALGTARELGLTHLERRAVQLLASR
ncbi:MAG TPA: AAA family ATPase [Sporichthya sp.]|nr:AAA family ATPase [Sporichthya sp.]